MAGLAAHILMSAFQRKTGAGFVIEEGWLPLGAVVTVRTRRDVRRAGELGSVNIFMAFLALVGSHLKVHIH